MPKPTKLTPETHAKIVNYVRGGVFLETACAAAGIGTQTMRDWLKRATVEPKSIYADFAADVEKAMGQDEARTVINHERLSGATVDGTGECHNCGAEVTVRVPVPGNVQVHALQWKLERKFPTRYGNRQTVVHEIKVQEAIEELLTAVKPRMSTGAYVELVTAVAAEMGESGLAEGGGDTATH